MRPGRVIIAIVLLTCFLYCSTASAQANCDKGWFGLQCRYKCRCTNNKCDINGTCQEGSRCQTNWFGPACQYSNIVQRGVITPTGLLELTDDYETTCSDNNVIKNLNVTWNKSIPFTWLRLGVNSPNLLTGFRLLLHINNSDVTCGHVTLSAIDSHTLDIHCSEIVMVNKVTLMWEGVSRLCYLYISEGRNVAIRQNSSQSSSYSDTTFKMNASRSDNAVDGNTSGVFREQSCTHTNEENNPSWQVNFTTPKRVNRYVLYNRDTNKERLQGFLLESFADNGSLVFNYLDQKKDPQGTYIFKDTDVTRHIQAIKISKISNKAEILTLCEVEAYGDSVCEFGRYGRDCENPCKCEEKNETCFVSTGDCPSGCVAGFYGEGCQKECSKGTFGAGCRQQCSQNCFDSDCDRVTGVCKDCIPGKVGDQCDISCSNGTYGRKCNETCSKNCNGTQGCNIENGTCIEGCTPGYTGSLCDQECSKGTYGAGCRQNCSQNCSDTDCDRVTGVCKDCPPGKDGDQCDISCSSGTYGHKCNKTCSNNCNGTQSCNIENGTCIEGCLPGYNGSLCDENCKNGKYGQDCTSNCSQFCVVDEIKNPSVCHHESGTCHLGCTNEYEGLNCLKLKIQEDTSNPGAVAGPIIVVLLLAIIVVIGVFLWRKRKQTKRSNSIDNGSQGNLTESGVSGLQPISAGLNGPAIHFQVYKPPLFTNQGDITPPDKDNETIYCNTVSEPKTTIAVDDLNKFMLSHKREYFVEQFKKIPPPSNTSMSVGLSAENKSKNRYKNICPYDHSRVQLIVDGEKYNGDYINASYVQGYNNKVKFIASQGPSKVILEDFIRMLWEQKTDVVVMLTNLVEEGKPKCEKYWPEDNELVLGEIKLKLMESQVFSDCIIRKMKLSQANQTHTVTQFHYISWPDKGVPSNPWSLVDFEHRVASCSTRRPLVVHCSAGVGRTGTFIALQNVIAQSEDTGFMDFYCTTSKLRQDRVNMIQTVDQYIFLHTAAQFALVCLGKTVTASDIIQKIEALEEISASGQTGMENEFKAVCNVSANDSEGSEEEESGRGSSSTYQNSRTSVNKLKNRFSNVLPKENYRPRLFCETKEFGEYINAVLLPSLTSQDSQMLTQLPLPTTVIDFWRMVTQYKVSLIVAFEVDPDDSTVGSYLPSESNKVMHCGPFEIETMSKNSEVLWEEKVLSIMRQKKRKNSLSLASSTHQADACQVTHLKCIKCDLDPEELLAVVQQVRSYSPRDKSKVLYMCRNGADYSGLLCVLSLLLERMDNDRQLILPLVVSTIKNVRPQVIPTLNQYRTLYQVLKLHSAALNTYANCGDQMSGKITGMGVSNYAFDKKENENVYANF